MTLSYWEDPNTDWEKLVLGGVLWPGIVVDIDANVERKLDVKKSKGQDKATIKDEGYRPAPIKVVLMIFTREQWVELQAILPQFHPRQQGGTRTPLQIAHPAVNLLNIDSVYIRKISSPKVDGPKGGPALITIELLEFVEAPKAVKGGAGTGGPKGTGTSTQAQDNDAAADALAQLAADAVNDAIDEAGNWLVDSLSTGG